jgi:hypothetical protein
VLEEIIPENYTKGAGGVEAPALSEMLVHSIVLVRENLIFSVFSDLYPLFF